MISFKGNTMFKMMFKILLSLFLLLSLLDAKWQSISPLSAYDKPSDFNLKKGIAYLEIRAYVAQPLKRGYRVLFSTDKHYVENMDTKLKNKFKSVKAIEDKGDIHLEKNIYRGGSCTMTYNAVIVRDDAKIYKMNMHEDIRSFLGKIDTKGEIALLLWLQDEDNTIEEYRKTAKGFEMRGWYKPLLGGDRYCVDRQYQRHFRKDIQLFQEKIIKTKKTKRGCLGCILPAMQECR
jgi:hypothetical protein